MSISRAIYSTYYQLQSTIYLFDDPLSALDAHVAKHVFNSVIGKQSLLEKSTRILVTNALHLLPQCDRIYVIDNGEIIETGTYQQLATGTSSFSNLLRDYTIGQFQIDTDEVEAPNLLGEKDEDLADIYDDRVDYPITSNRQLLRQESTVSNKIKTVGPHCRKPLKSSSSTNTNKEEQDDKLDDKPEPDLEKIEQGTVKAQVFKNYFNAVGIPYITAIILCYIAAHAAGSGADIWLSKWEKGQNFTEFDSQEDIQRDSMRRLSIYASIGASKVSVFF